MIYTIARIVKSSTDFKTGTPKCAISVFLDIQFLRLTLKIVSVSAISGLQWRELRMSRHRLLEDYELDIGSSCSVIRITRFEGSDVQS